MKLRDIIEELDRLDFQGSGAMASQVTWFCKKLWEANAYYTKLERDKASAEAMTTVWKESYLDQVRENVRLQAKSFAGVAGKYEDKIGDEYNEIMSRLSEEGKENWRKFIRQLIKELDNEQT